LKIVVPEAGLEPARSFGTRDFKSLASTNSATPATVDFIRLSGIWSTVSLRRDGFVVTNSRHAAVSW
jgi:hypothetical protein